MLALATQAVLANSHDHKAEDIEQMSLKELMDLEVFNSATLLPTEISKAPGTVYSFAQNDFDRLGIRRLDDLFAYVPGFQLNQYRKRHRKIWARGLIDLYNDKLILMVDGVRRQHAYYGHFSLGDNFPLEKIAKVEIIVGPASSVYGANAFGGIISVTTKDFSKEKHIAATAEGGSNGRGKGTLSYNSEHLQLFGSYLSQDAPFREDRKSFIGSETLQPLDEQFGNLFMKVSPFKGFTFSADYYRNDTPFLFIPPTQDAFIEEESLTVTAAYETGNLEQGKLSANIYFTWDNAREYEKEQKTQALGYEEFQNALIAGSTITGFKRLFDDHILALGFNWMHVEAGNMDYTRWFHFRDGFLDPPETGNLLSNPTVSNDDIALYIQDVWQFNEQFEFTLGGRFDHFEEFGDYFNYRVAAVFTPDENQTVKLLYGTAIRTPTFREYLKVLEGTDFVAPIPKPESLQSVELAYMYQWTDASLSVTLYHNEVDNYIHVVPTPDDEDEYFANSESPWVLRGVEAMLRYRLWNRVDLRLSGSYLNGEEKGQGAIPYLSDWTANFTLNYDYMENHQAGFALIYNSSRQDTNFFPDDDPNEFLIVNLFASGQFNRNIGYAFGVDNLFDSRVYDPAADFGGQHNTERSEREIWGRLKWGFDL